MGLHIFGFYVLIHLLQSSVTLKRSLRDGEGGGIFGCGELVKRWAGLRVNACLVTWSVLNEWSGAERRDPRDGGRDGELMWVWYKKGGEWRSTVDSMLGLIDEIIFVLY